MEPPGGLPPDRDKARPSMLRAQTSQQQAQPNKLKPSTLPLNIPSPQQPQQHATTVSATSPAIGGDNNAVATGSSSGVAISVTCATTPTLASAATAISATTQAATAFSGSSIGQHTHQQHHGHQSQQNPQLGFHPPLQANSSSSGSSSLLGALSSSSVSYSQQQQTIEKLSRPMAFDKMESLVREMQDPEHGVPVRQQKMFLTSIPYAFMGYDLIEWLMDRLLIEESEALNIANQLCLHGYFFPVNDTKTLTVKDDSSLYRFQTPYYWPWQHKAPDNVEYAIYLVKRSLRNKQRHALEDYEAEALASLHKNLKGKWDFISMQAEEQVRLAKERKKGDKIVGDSQERAYWRVHRPPPGQFTPLEPCPVPSRDRQGTKHNKKKTIDDMQREVDYLTKSLNRTRMKMSQACETLVHYSETFTEYDFFLQPVLPSNPWVTEDITFWQLNNTFVDIPTEKRVRRWAISIEELVSDPTGLQEFTSFLEKEYSHENIRFWIAVNRLRRSAHSQVPRKVQEIYEEFLKPGAPCEINIDGKTMESVLKGLKNPSRFTFDAASEHIYMLLLKKDCYPRFIRSDHYKRLLETGIQPSHKKRFFNFGGVGGAKKKMTAALSSQPNMTDVSTSSLTGKSSTASMMQAPPPPGSLSRRRGSDRSLTGSAHELAVIGVCKDQASKVPHSHSQSNLSEIPYSDTIYRGDMPDRNMETGLYASSGRNFILYKAQQETPKSKSARLEPTAENSSSSAVCPWDMPDNDEPPAPTKPTTVAAAAVAIPSKPTEVKLSVCPWKNSAEPSPIALNKVSSGQRLTSTSSDNTDVADRLQRNLGIRHQNTVDSGEASAKHLIPNFNEQRRASISFTPGRQSEFTGNRTVLNATKTTTPSPSGGIGGGVSCGMESKFLPFVSTIQGQNPNVIAVITKDPSMEIEIDEELHRLSISERNSVSSTSELAIEGNSPMPTPTLTPTPTPTPTPPPQTKVTPPPPPTQPQPLDNLVAVVEKQYAVDNPSNQSPQSDNSSSTNAPVFDEVTATVQEVQIELIEAPELKESRPPIERITTPTIQIEEEYISIEENIVHSPTPTPTPKSPMQQTRMDDIVELQMQVEIIEYKTANSEIVPPPLPEIGPLEEEAQLQEEQEQGEEEQEAEEEAEEEALAAQEELSPTTDEYHEGIRFGGDSKDEYSYEIVDTDTDTQIGGGYIPPAPTPAPSMAPLAELDPDTVDDDLCCEAMDVVETATPFTETTAVKSEAKPETITTTVNIATTTDEVRKRRKKRSSDGKKMSSLDEKDKDKAGTSNTTATKTCGGGKGKPEADQHTVCPWEDETVSTSDGTFVKTYATLGYL